MSEKAMKKKFQQKNRFEQQPRIQWKKLKNVTWTLFFDKKVLWKFRVFQAYKQSVLFKCKPS